jgi:hypothetical protein
MPALANPRHEAFAQAIVASLANGDAPHSNGRAYIAAGYSAKEGASADSAASSRLRLFKPILARVAELQAQALARLEPKLDISRERIGRRLDKASRIAERLDNPAAMATCELGLAKVFHSLRTDDEPNTSFKSARNMHDIGRRLLMSCGYSEPDDASVQLAVEANDAFVDRLHEICRQAQQTLGQV